MFEIGNTLREARRRAGLDVETIEAATKIRGKYLQAMEEERFELLPEEPYTEGFLRTYAAYLGLDPTLVLDEYRSRFHSPVAWEPEPRLAKEPARRPKLVDRLVAPRSRARRSPRALAWIAVGGAAALALFLWVGLSGGSSRSSSRTPAAVPSGAATPAHHAATPAHHAATPAHHAAKPTSPAPAAHVELTLTARGNGSYVQLRREGAAGRTLYDGVLAPGTARTFVSRSWLWMRVGWTPNLGATVNGHPSPLSGGTANFRVDREGLRRAL